MPFYETVFMTRQDLSENQVKDLTKKFAKIIEDQGGKVTKTEQWGLKTLAYKINKAKKAHYTLFQIDGPGAAVIELERVMRIDEDVMRSLTTRIETLTEGPTIMMDKSDKYDKNDKFDKKEAA